ncbi:SDR family NAD(P)-dependent oxidoreductase [Cryptosporangium sp. NPDC048952]|uniref:SDR family NAD(P)-dependent oxidoreductase n=1 Tax=Cryptosporangium sp. NPDC048952 TaxID=3363961 RepID=UPI003710B7D4
MPRVAIVTGAARGLGQEFAVALAGRGCVIAGFDVADQSATQARIDGGFLPVEVDVTDESAVATAVERVAATLGAPGIVVNNAGIYPPIEFEDTTLDDWHRILRLNLDGPFLVTQAALPYLRAQGWGRIVNIVSAAVDLGPPDLVAYTTSKAGLVGFTRALASAVGKDGITVNAIAPGLTHTETAAATTGAHGGFEHVRSLQAIPRTEVPEDVVSTLLYVCDEGSGFLTGQTINVDGGSTRS